MERHGYVLRPGAVTVGCREDAAVPNVGLEVVTISVVGHGTGHAIVAVDWGRRGWSLYRRFQCVRLTHTHLCRVAHALKMEGGVPGRLLTEVGPTVLNVGYMSQLVLIPRAHLLMLCVMLQRLLLLIMLWMWMLQVVLLLEISMVGRQVVHSSHAWWWVTSHQGGSFLVRANDAVGRGEARGGRVAVHGDPGAGADKQVATDWAGVCDLALAHRGGSRTLGPSLAELVDLMHNCAQVGLTALLQPSSHGEWNG